MDRKDKEQRFLEVGFAVMTKSMEHEVSKKDQWFRNFMFHLLLSQVSGKVLDKWIKYWEQDLDLCPAKNCRAIINKDNRLIDAERYSVGDRIGYCDTCYDPTPL